MQALQDIIESIDTLITSADIDYNELLLKELNEDIFNDFNDQRIINSFLFNFTKLQELKGAKLFKTVLIQLKEIDSYSISYEGCFEYP